MIFKHNILTLGAASFLVVAVLSANNPVLIQSNLDGNILNLIARSQHLMQRDPNLFSACLDTYVSDMKVATDNLKKDHEDCCSDADSKRSIADSKCLVSRNNLANRTEAACVAWDQCKKATSVDEEYQCYLNGGNENEIVSRAVANNASFGLVDYKEQIRIIQYNEGICKDRTNEVYKNTENAAYALFDGCCKGRVSPSPTSPLPPTPNETTVVS